MSYLVLERVRRHGQDPRNTCGQDPGYTWTRPQRDMWTQISGDQGDTELDTHTHSPGRQQPVNQEDCLWHKKKRGWGKEENCDCDHHGGRMNGQQSFWNQKTPEAPAWDLRGLRGCLLKHQQESGPQQWQRRRKSTGQARGHCQVTPPRSLGAADTHTPSCFQSWRLLWGTWESVLKPEEASMAGRGSNEADFSTLELGCHVGLSRCPVRPRNGRAAWGQETRGERWAWRTSARNMDFISRASSQEVTRGFSAGR